MIVEYAIGVEGRSAEGRNTFEPEGEHASDEGTSLHEKPRVEREGMT